MDDIIVRQRKITSILTCSNRYFRMESERMVIFESFKKEKEIRYADISMLLFLDTDKNQAVILLDGKNKRLLNFSLVDMINADKLQGIKSSTRRTRLWKNVRKK